MIVKVEKEGNFLELKSIIEKFDNDSLISGILVYTCDENNFSPKEFTPLLKNCGTQIFGGIFPSIIYGGAKYNKGSVLIGFTTSVQSLVLQDIHTNLEDLQDQLEEFSDNCIGGKTYIINMDGLSSGGEVLKEELFYSLGLSKNYIGGGAGSLSFDRKPCVITNDGLLLDAAVIALLDVKSGVGVSHGWKDISQPMKVTEIEGNNLISLNWEPAYKVYQEQIKEISGLDINESNFFDIAKSYPFGISKMGTEMVVRDPIRAIDNEIIECVGAIPKNSFVYLLNGKVESLIKGAKCAKQLAKEAFTIDYKKEIPSDRLLLFIDCISRALFLEDQYYRELEAIGSKNLVGALTLGEIANTGKAYLELYNKTSVVGILEE